MSETGVSPGEAGGMVAGAIMIFAALGKGLAWLLNWKQAREDSRAARLKAWEESLDRREKDYHTRTEARLANVEKKMTALSHLLFAAVAELERLDPASALLVRIKIAMKKWYPVDDGEDTEPPEPIRDLVRRIDLEGPQ